MRCRGYPPEDADAGISFVAYGGTAEVRKCQVWALKSIWKRDFQPHEQQSVFETIYEVRARTVNGKHAMGQSMPKALFLLETSVLHKPFCALQCLASMCESYSTLCILGTLGTFSTCIGHARLHLDAFTVMVNFVKT